MKITADDSDDAFCLAKALADHLRQALINSGRLHYCENEDPYYTVRRELLRNLEEFTK